MIAAQLLHRIDIRERRGEDLLGDEIRGRVVEQRPGQAMLDRKELAVAKGLQLRPALSLRIRREAGPCGGEVCVKAGLHGVGLAHPGRAGDEDRLRIGCQHIFRVERAPAAGDVVGGDVVCADLVEQPAPHRLPIGVADGVRTALAQLDIDLRRTAGRRGALADVGELVGVEGGEGAGPFLVAGGDAQGDGAGHMPLGDLGVVVDHHHRNAQRFQLLDLRRQVAERPFRHDHQVWPQRQHLFQAEIAVLGVADIRQIGQARDRHEVAPEHRGTPVGPQGAGEPHHAVPALRTGDGRVFLVVEAEHDARGGRLERDGAAERVGDGRRGGQGAA
jgi:hypothetical protein